MSPQGHIVRALAALEKAQAALKSERSREVKGEHIVALERKIHQLRDSAIKADLATGLSGREVALKYDLSQGRVSQIKNS